uniref:SAM domain-containing protein n=1 Tax=Trichobilharzia regenti TaxID=157069 RepID=A0AA85K9B6_TRIRE|nr:unnamed protein product [Trichobilharzia regenti]
MSITEICKNALIPPASLWDIHQVASWIEDIGYPQYKKCFIENRIDGCNLIKVNSTTLPNLGVRKFEDVKDIACKVRELLNLEETKSSQHLYLPERDIMGMYLEARSYTGSPLCKLSFPRFVYTTQHAIWKPPLTNEGIIFQHKH